jgi:RNA-dependent RNA polymerase
MLMGCFQLGNPMVDEIAQNVVITFANIRKMARGFDYGHPCNGSYYFVRRIYAYYSIYPVICFELLTPPVFQLERFNRTLTGVDWKDERKFRQRLSSLSEAHAQVAPYAHQIRMILHDERDLDKFCELCLVAEIPMPGKVTGMEACSNEFFSPLRFREVDRALVKFKDDWSVAFQLEALLRNGLLNTEDLLKRLIGPVVDLCARHPTTAVGTMRQFVEAMRAKDPRQSLMDCFEECMKEVPEAIDLSPGTFMCHHVTVTPTRMLLAGPYVIQSNRVIRQYRGYEDHFIRVDFRDEDRLQYRWDRDVSSMFD